jgi:hypothetical protein
LFFTVAADFLTHLLPYAQASVFQRTQALNGARQVLDAAYPFLNYSQWQHALEHLQLPLQVTADQAALTHDGLAALVQYLAARYHSSPAPGAGATPSSASEPPAAKSRKQTYAVSPAVVEQLARVSHWCRISKSQLVSEALVQLLRQYPEANLPLPEV